MNDLTPEPLVNLDRIAGDTCDTFLVRPSAVHTLEPARDGHNTFLTTRTRKVVVIGDCHKVAGLLGIPVRGNASW